MTDLTKRLRALSRHKHDDLSIGDEAADEIERLRAELSDQCALMERLSAILTATANALKGKPKRPHLHSWHDLAEVAGSAVAERDALRARIEDAPIVTMKQLGHGIKPGDYAVLWNWNEGGKRVALVMLEDGE